MKSIPELIYDTRRDDDSRSYLGASSIGYSCDRRLWMAFRWCAKPKFEGRMLRLFNRGHREEAVFISELKRICSGAVMADDPDTGKQFEFEALNGHIQCHLDGVAFGIPMEGVDKEQAHLLEFKTLSDKSFRDLESNGLSVSKPVYYAQIQLCMHLAELEACLFLAVNKNNDELYAERVEYNPDFAADIMSRGERIVFAPSPPDRIGSPAWYECKYCPLYDTCHNGIIPDVNCRTCCHSTPLANGTWHCEKHARTISCDEQRVGCGNHIFHPDLIDAELVEGNPEYILYRDRNGNVIANGAYVPKSDSDEVFIFDSRPWRASTLIQSVTIEFDRPPKWLVKIGDKMATRRRRTMKSKMPDAIAGRLTPEERAWQEMQLSKKVVSLEADLQFMCEEILRMRGLWYLHLTDPSTRYNNPGVPDLIICAYGKFLAVELKSQTGTVSGAQHAQMAKIKDNGGEAFVCRSVERFIEILDGLKEE